jgi:hypothetical protein
MQEQTFSLDLSSFFLPMRSHFPMRTQKFLNQRHADKARQIIFSHSFMASSFHQTDRIDLDHRAGKQSP